MSTEPAQPARTEQSAQTAPSGPGEKFVTPRSLLVGAVLVIAFFAFIFNVIRPHVPTESTLFIILWGGGAAACLTGVFWLAVQMFRVVLRAQLAERRGK